MHVMHAVNSSNVYGLGVGRVGEVIEVTALIHEVHVFSRQSLTR